VSQPTSNPPSGHRRRKGWFFLILFVAALVFVARSRPRESEVIYKGRSVREWFDLASPGEPVDAKNAHQTVIEMGPLAIPHLIKMLDDSNHRPLNKAIEWLRWHLPERVRWNERDNCTDQHGDAIWWLSQMGEAARPAVPAIIRCFKECPCQHYVQGRDMIECLGELGPVAREALPFLADVAANTNSGYRLTAAAATYYISRERNILIKTFCREARQDPENYLYSREPFWFRSDPEVNREIVPVLAKLLFDPRLDDSDRDAVVCELQARGTYALAALPALMKLLSTTESPETCVHILAALPRIAGLIDEPEDEQLQHGMMEAMAAHKRPNALAAGGGNP
jgi:hypothetical protein